MIKFAGRCFYCHAPLCYAQATTDHFIPRKRGGPNCEANRVLACSPCNQAKGSFNPVQLGIWHPHDDSEPGRRALLQLRRIIVRRQLSKLRERRKIQAPSPGLPTKADPLATPIPFHSRPEGTAALATDKPLPVYDAFSIEKKSPEDRNEKPVYRPIGAAWADQSNNGAINLALKVLPLDGRVLLLPHEPGDKPPPEDSGSSTPE